jgi:hypothetical protein
VGKNRPCLRLRDYEILKKYYEVAHVGIQKKAIIETENAKFNRFT